MKIDTHSISFKSEYSFSQTVTSSFEAEVFSFAAPMKEASLIKQPEIPLIERLRIALLQQLLELFHHGTSSCESPKEVIESLHVNKNEPTNSFRGLRKDIRYERSFHEEESLHVTMQGHVQTSSGQSIEIAMEVGMSRSFYSKTQFSKSVFIDPLVINFEGTLPDLSKERFAFDIDSDGALDQISMLQQGNGFLARDHNSNGLIDNGAELFGTQSGNGFKDLSFYDEDNNAWIDENDPIFEGLRIWSHCEGKSTLCTLGEKGIGAIYLGSTSSSFTFKDESQESLGRLRQTGIFLFEDAKVGNISQVDFTKEETKAPLKEALESIKT